MRDNPNQDLSGLNRDINLAQTITNDTNIYVDTYFSASTVHNILTEGLDGDLGRAWAFPNTLVGAAVGLLGAGINVIMGVDNNIHYGYNVY